jgi:uncharacterized protein YheU (UPF0270 family)
MQKTKATQDLDQPQQDIQPTVAQQCHEESAEVVGKSLDVNENDVRDQNRPGTAAVKGEQQPHGGSAKVVGKSLEVNENDVRDQNRSGTEPVKGGQQCHANKKD